MQLIQDGIKLLTLFLIIIHSPLTPASEKGNLLPIERILKLAKTSPFVLRDNSKDVTTLLQWNPIDKSYGILRLHIIKADGSDILLSKKKIKQFKLAQLLGQKKFTTQLGPGSKIKTVSSFSDIINKKTKQIVPTLSVTISGFKTRGQNLPNIINLEHKIDVSSINLLQFWDNNPSNTKDEQLYIYDLFRPGFSNWYEPKTYSAKIKNLIKELRVMGLPEIVAMQELESANNSAEFFKKNGLLSLELQKLGYNFYYLGIQEDDNLVALTTGFISKYPLENSSIKMNVNTPEFVNFSGRDKKTAAYTTRDIQFATLKLANHKLLLFNNHWRSQGCGSPSSCAFSLQVRVASANLLLNKINKEVTDDNHLTDVIMLGDFNCDYTDKPLQVFGKTGSEKLTQAKHKKNKFYNLWYELTKNKRWEATHSGKASTLSHIIINSNMYDGFGFQYTDNSFRVVGQKGEARKLLMNVDGSPLRWQEKRLRLNNVSAKNKKLINEVISKRNCNGKRSKHKRCRPIYTEFSGDGFGDHLPLVSSFYYVGTNSETATNFNATDYKELSKPELINIEPFSCSSFSQIEKETDFKKLKGKCISLDFSKNPIKLFQQGIYDTPFIKVNGVDLGLSIVRSFDPRPIRSGLPIEISSKEMHNESNMCFARRILQGKGGNLKSAKGILGFQNGLPTLFALSRNNFVLVDLPTSKQNSCKNSNSRFRNRRED